jgi:hypothetical protein
MTFWIHTAILFVTGQFRNLCNLFAARVWDERYVEIPYANRTAGRIGSISYSFLMEVRKTYGL